jgi:hypothetical protein
MRKLLLASVAMLGVAGLADRPALAQLSVDYSGQAPDAGQSPAPGTITVRLNGRFQFFAGYSGQSYLNDSYYYDAATGTARTVPFVVAPSGTVVTTTAGAGGAPVVPTTAGGVAVPGGFYRAASLLHEKVGGASFVDLARLYPGFDGVAANGLKYGASFEIRSSDIGGAGGASYASPSNVSRARDTLQFRRAYGYVGTNDFGTLRFGMTDGPSSLMMVGNFENFNSGGWNGAIPASFGGQFDSPWPFPDVGAEYATNKIVYLSPQLYGFDLGVSYEPNTSGLNGDNQNGCEAASFSPVTFGGPGNVAGPGCDLLSSTASGDLRRRRNTIDVALRYRGTFGPIGFAAFADYTTSGKVNDSSYYGSALQRQQFKDYSIGFGGAQITYAGFTVGGMARGGSINTIDNNEALQPAGTTPQSSYLAGASYTYGPLVVGTHWFETWQAGAQNGTNTAFVGGYHARGIAYGGTYSLAPGVAVYLEGLWGQIRQNGADLDLGVSSTAATGAGHVTTNNIVHVNYLGTGIGLSW